MISVEPKLVAATGMKIRACAWSRDAASSNLLAYGTALGAVGGGAALAADMAVKSPPPPIVSPASWNGLYIGGNLGAASEHAAGTSDFLDTVAAGTPFAANPQATHLIPKSSLAAVRSATIGNLIRDGSWVSKATGISPIPITTFVDRPIR